VDPDSRRLHIAVTDGRGRLVRDHGLARWLAAVAPARLRGDVAVALVSDAHIRRLNRTYRRKDVATDVLSFAAGAAPAHGAPARPLRRHLGDVVIATGVARRQARAHGHPYATELRVLALHGLLHLLGYNHDAPDDGGRMARAEARLRRKGGLRHGLLARKSAPSGRRPGGAAGGRAS